MWTNDPNGVTDPVRPLMAGRRTSTHHSDVSGTTKDRGQHVDLTSTCQRSQRVRTSPIHRTQRIWYQTDGGARRSIQSDLHLFMCLCLWSRNKWGRGGWRSKHQQKASSQAVKTRMMSVVWEINKGDEQQFEKFTSLLIQLKLFVKMYFYILHLWFNL